MSQAPARLSEAEFRALESLLSGTARGRWFLAEYARRNAPSQPPETETLLTALRRLETVATGTAFADPYAEARAALERARTELATTGRHAENVRATEAMRGLVAQIDEAALELFANAEAIHQLSWTMREQGFAASTCDAIKARAHALEAAATQLRLARGDADILARCIAAMERGLSGDAASSADDPPTAAASDPTSSPASEPTPAALQSRIETASPPDVSPRSDEDRAARLTALQRLTPIERIALCS